VRQDATVTPAFARGTAEVNMEGLLWFVENATAHNPE